MYANRIMETFSTEYHTLLPFEERAAKALAKERHDRNVAAGIEDQYIGPKDNRKRDEQHGCGAELAYCKLANVMPDFRTDPQSLGYDCTYMSFCIDVKWTWMLDGDLLVKLEKKKDPDTEIYVLMVGQTFGRYKFIGWYYALDVYHKDNINDLGKGPTYQINRKLLRGGVNVQKTQVP